MKRLLRNGSTQAVWHLYFLLRQGLYHVTSVEGYRGIRCDGFIRPWDGSLRAAFPTGNSHARRHKWISLFVFETPTEERCFQVRHQWSGFLVKEKPVAVLIHRSRENLVPELIPNDAVETEVNYWERLRIPYVEVWYPKPIPLSAVQSYIVVFPSKPVRYLRLKATNDGLTELDRVLEEIESLISAGVIKVLSARDRFLAQGRQPS